MTNLSAVLPLYETLESRRNGFGYCVGNQLRSILAEVPHVSGEHYVFRWSELYMSIWEYILQRLENFLTLQQCLEGDFGELHIGRDPLGLLFGTSTVKWEDIGGHLYENVVPYVPPRVLQGVIRRGRTIGRRYCLLSSPELPESVRWRADSLVEALETYGVLERLQGSEVNVSRGRFALQGGREVQLLVDYNTVRCEEREAGEATKTIPYELAFPRRRPSERLTT